MKRKHILGIALASLILGLSLTVVAVDDAKQDGKTLTWYDNERQFKSGDPKYNVRRTEHFRLVWGKGVGEGNVNNDFRVMNEQRVRGHMQSLEQIWHTYHDPEPRGLGLNIPGTSNIPANNDGKLYRTNFIFNNTGIWEGGAWGACDEWGFQLFAINPGFTSYDPPNGATAHEYGHTVQINFGGFNETPYDGMWHEASANWLDMQFADDQDIGPMTTTHFFSLPHGRNYYHCWQIWEYLREQPAYGASFFNKMWTQANGNTAKGAEYIFDAMARLGPSGSPDPYNAVKDNLGKMAAHNVTWDYERGVFFRAEAPLSMDPLNGNYRNGMSEPIRRMGDTSWYRIPFEHAPSQGGYAIIPIALNGKTGAGYTVSINFKPLWDASRGSDWRATFVAVNDSGEPRYSTMWNCGVNSITLSRDENKLFLVVSATPDFMGFEGFSHPLIADPVLAPQAFEIAFVKTKAGPYESKSPARPEGVTGKAHPNGGGFAADTAKVDASAYVAPKAMVLGSAQVRGSARVEDYAVVTGNAVVKDNAVLSGHALVKDNAEVYGSAKVRDWATVSASWKVFDNGRALEHANLVDKGQLHENSTIKGASADFGNADVKGYAIKDGDCSNGANVDHQVLTCWVWGTDQGYADSVPDTGGLYCNYNFEKTRPNYALDTFGVIHGYLMGSPQVVQFTDKALGNALKLNGKDQYVELRKDVFDFKDITIAAWVRWDGGAAGQRIFSFGSGLHKYMGLTPSDATGKVKFVINGGKGDQALVGDSALPKGAWTHVAVTLKSDTGTLYIDGKPAASGRISISPDDLFGPNVMNSGDYAYIGRGSKGSYFAGCVDDFRVYGFAQPADKIAALADSVKDRKPLQSGSLPPVEEAVLSGAAKFLMNPTAISDTAVTMTAARPGKAGSWVEYYFKCTSGGGHDSGWISASKYTDCGLKPGTKYAYTVRMRNKDGDESAESVPVIVTTPVDKEAPAGKLAFGPVGVSDTTIKMIAAKGEDLNDLVEYRFTRGDGKTTGWKSTATWTDTGLTPGKSYTYAVQMRDGRGNVGRASAPKSAVAMDDTPPARFVKGEWLTRPYALLDDTIVLKARHVTGGGRRAAKIEDDPVEYSFHCVSGNAPDSGWIDSPSWTTPELKDGTYVYEFKMRDKSPQRNETGYSSAEAVTISDQTGYRDYAVSQLASLHDCALVSFKGKVTSVEKDHYVVSGDDATIKVVPATKGDETDPALNGKDVTVKGTMWTVSDEERVTWAELK